VQTLKCQGATDFVSCAWLRTSRYKEIFTVPYEMNQDLLAFKMAVVDQVEKGFTLYTLVDNKGLYLLVGIPGDPKSVNPALVIWGVNTSDFSAF